MNWGCSGPQILITCPGSRRTPPSAPPPGLALRPLGRDLAALPTGHRVSGEASRMQLLSRRRLGPPRRGGSGPNRRCEAGVRSARTRTDPAVPLDLRCGAERRPALQFALAHLLPRRRATQGPRSLWQPWLARDLCSSAWGAGWEWSVQLFTELGVFIFSDCPSIFPPFSIHYGPGDGRGGTGFRCCTN